MDQSRRILMVTPNAFLRNCLVSLLLDHGWTDDQLLLASDKAEALKVLEIQACSAMVVGGPCLRQYWWIQGLHLAHPTTPILAVSASDHLKIETELLRVGASGVVNLHTSCQAVVQAVKQVVEGGMYLAPHLADRILDWCRHSSPDPTNRHNLPSLETLSERELQVFELLGQGVLITKIATTLGVSPKTVETYQENIKRKLDLKNNSELRVLASFQVLLLETPMT